MKHRRAFRKLTKKIVRDLNKLGITEYQTDVTKEERSLYKKFFTHGYGDTQETLIVTSGFQDYTFNIHVPMAKGGIAPPYIIEFFIPVPMNGWAEYRHKMLKNKWYTEPDDKQRIADLKNTVPKAKMKQSQVSKQVPISAKYTVKVGHYFGPVDNNTSVWMVHSGYEGGMFSGGKRPFIAKFITVLPEVRQMLEEWRERDT